VTTASYALLPLVQPRDVMVHYDSRQEAIVGVSMAASPAEPAPIYWVARGSYARRAGERPPWLPGIRVALARCRGAGFAGIADRNPQSQGCASGIAGANSGTRQLGSRFTPCSTELPTNNSRQAPRAADAEDEDVEVRWIGR
jgi:hypothetical protein